MTPPTRCVYVECRTVPRWNCSDVASLAKGASASQQVMLAGTTPMSQNHVELKVNSPVTTLSKSIMYKNLAMCFMQEGKQNYVRLNTEENKELIRLLCLHDEVSRSGKQKREHCYLLQGFCFFPCTEQIVSIERGKKGRV